MNVVITGGLGCIGCYVIRDLLREGARVRVFDAVPDLSIASMVLTESEIEALEIEVGDIRDMAHLMRTVQTVDAETVVHLASFQIPASNANPALALQVNNVGTVNVFETARILKLRKVVWASSIAVFGSVEDYGGRRIANDAPHLPKSIYGGNKSLNELYGCYYADNYGLDIVGMRFTAVYGVGRTRGMSSFTTRMIEAAALGESYEVPFGDDAVDWQYVEDVSASIVAAVKSGRTKTHNFTIKGEQREVREGYEYLKRLAPDADIRLLSGYFGISWDYDAEPAAAELGFRPAYTMEAGILKTFNRFRELHGLPAAPEPADD